MTKSPLTDSWGDASIGGPFATKLKQAGFDAVFIKGIAPHPVYLTLIDGRATLHDARHLWGKDARETIDLTGRRSRRDSPRYRLYRPGRREPLADRRDHHDSGSGGAWRSGGGHGGEAAQGDRRSRWNQGRGGGRRESQSVAAGHLQEAQHHHGHAAGEVSRPGHLRRFRGQCRFGWRSHQELAACRRGGHADVQEPRQRPAIPDPRNRPAPAVRSPARGGCATIRGRSGWARWRSPSTKASMRSGRCASTTTSKA